MAKKVEEKKVEFDNTPVEETPKKKMPKGVKIPLLVLGGLVGTITLVWGGLNVAKYPIYHEFYSIKKDICKIPGLDKEPTAQGCTYDSVLDCIYTTAYTTDKAATVYTVKNGKSIAHTLRFDGKDFTGHVGGIATSGDLAYIANDDYVYTVRTSDLNDASKKVVDVANAVPVNDQASCIYCDDTYVYVAEFHDGKHYFTHNPYKENDAIIEKFAKEDFDIGSTDATPLEVYSIMDKVQGFTITPSGKYVFSTSYGLASSHIYVYDSDKLVATNEEMHAAPLYEFVGKPKDILAPAMTEDLDIYKDGTVMTLTESASNKYVFGKFFFANNIFTMNIK